MSTDIHASSIKGSTCENWPRKCVSPLVIVKTPTGVFEPSRPHYRHKRHPLFAGLFSALCNQIHTPRRTPLLRKTLGISDLFLPKREEDLGARTKVSSFFRGFDAATSLHTNRGEKTIGWIETVDDDPPILVLYRLGYVLNYLPPCFSFIEHFYIFLIYYYSQLDLFLPQIFRFPCFNFSIR